MYLYTNIHKKNINLVVFIMFAEQIANNKIKIKLDIHFNNNNIL